MLRWRCVRKNIKVIETNYLRDWSSIAAHAHRIWKGSHVWWRSSTIVSPAIVRRGGRPEVASRPLSSKGCYWVHQICDLYHMKNKNFLRPTFELKSDFLVVVCCWVTAAATAWLLQTQFQANETAPPANGPMAKIPPLNQNKEASRIDSAREIQILPSLACGITENVFVWYLSKSLSFTNYETRSLRFSSVKITEYL